MNFVSVVVGLVVACGVGKVMPLIIEGAMSK
jgi:hypothetical protein